ncbi:MAG TPA: GspMb/PilO family protein [Bryobacteraceae bacterium]
MPKNFELGVWPPNNPRAIIRLGLGLLVAANLVAGYFAIRPIGGSPADLRQQEQEMRTQIHQQQGILDRTRTLAAKIEIGRGEGDKFMNKYFLPRRTAYSSIMSNLNDLASQSKVTPKESSNIIEEVEGSDTLQRMQVTANFEATFDNLIRFVNLLDKSNRLMIIESLNATPQQDGKRLTVLLKLDTFVREDGSPQ